MEIKRFLKKHWFVFFISILASCNSQNNSVLTTKEKVLKGKVLFNSVGCTTCHSVTGESKYGPSLNAILNTKVQVIRKDGQQTIKIDREYIRRSIQNPDYEKLFEFKNRKMPGTDLSPVQIEYITEFLISINEN